MPIVTMLGELFPNESADIICKGGYAPYLLNAVSDMIERTKLLSVIPADIGQARDRLQEFANKLRTSRLSGITDAQACSDARLIAAYVSPKATDLVPRVMDQSVPAPSCVSCQPGYRCRRWWPWLGLGIGAGAVVTAVVAAAVRKR